FFHCSGAHRDLHSFPTRRSSDLHQGTFLVEGKSTYVFALSDGRQVKGEDLQQQRDWPWRDSPQVPGMRYARLRATSPTYGAVTLDRKSTRLNSSHDQISYAVFCL